MSTPSAEAIRDKAAVVFGKEAQMRALQEECGELIAVINQYFRKRVDAEKVIEEIADVRNLCTQMNLFFGREAIDAAEDLKLKRLWFRMEAMEARP